MFCPKCGQNISGTEQFCPGCGMSFATASPSHYPKPTGAIVMVNIFGSIASLIILVQGISLTGLRSVQGTSVAEAFYQAIGSALIGISFLTAMLTIYCATRLSISRNK